MSLLHPEGKEKVDAIAKDVKDVKSMIAELQASDKNVTKNQQCELDDDNTEQIDDEHILENVNL